MMLDIAQWRADFADIADAMEAMAAGLRAAPTAARAAG